MPSGSHGAADEPVTAFAKGAASFSSDAGELQCRGLQYIELHFCLWISYPARGDKVPSRLYCEGLNVTVPMLSGLLLRETKLH